MGESRKVLNLVIQSVTVGAVEMFGGGAAAWRTIAFIYCIIGIITNTLAVFSVKELSDEDLKDDSVAGEEDDKLSFKQTIKLLFSNKYFSMICVIYILQQLRASLISRKSNIFASWTVPSRRIIFTFLLMCKILHTKSK